MFCREQVAQLGGIASELERIGVAVAVIAPGHPEQARAFQAEQHVTLPLYVDPSRRTFAAFAMKRGLAATLGPASILNAVRALAGGHRQGAVQGNPWQQGGAVVVLPDGRTIYQYVSKRAGDHPPAEALLDAARRAVVDAGR